MRISLFQRKLLLFGLAVVAINALLFSMFALGRISMWVVSHDTVNAQMDREGAIVEHGIAEIFMAPGGVGWLFIVASICSVGFLVFLWHTLFHAESCSSSSLSEPQKDFTVKFGKYARTIEYDDAEGHMLFTFDIGSKFDDKNPNGPGRNSLCLEHHAPGTPRSPRYSLAFERTKQFLESHGFEVEIYGE